MTGYYDLPKTRFTCNKCQWSGLGAMLTQGEVYQEIVEYDCPQCYEKVTFAAFPNREETEAAARTGDAEAARELTGFQIREQRWKRVIETQRSPVFDQAEFAEHDVHCELRLDDEDDETWLVLTANGREFHRELAVFESTEPAHRLFALMRRRYGDRLRSFNYDPALLYLGGDRLGAVRELDALVSDLPVGERESPDEAGAYFVIQHLGTPAPWALVAVRPRGLYEIWSGTEWVGAPYLATYFSGEETGTRQVDADQVAAMKATIGRPGPAHVALAKARGGARHAAPPPSEEAAADAPVRSEEPEVEFRSDEDAFSWMLARKASQHPEHWIVTVVEPTGRRTVEAGEAGRSHLFPTLSYTRHQEAPRMWPVGNSACHVEVVHSGTGESFKCEVPFRTCPHRDSRARDRDRGV